MKTINFFKHAILMVVIVFGLSLTSCEDDDDDDDNKPTNNGTELPAQYTEDKGKVTIKDNGEGTGTITWTADKTWILNGFVFVNEGQTLTIEPGTTIKAMPGSALDASALIVCRGAKIYANGTADKPIIFTALADNGSLAKDERGLWGGVIVLGKGVLNTADKTKQVEGIPTTEPRGSYGGDNDGDNSGSLKYISIRHGGSKIGEGDEINGLTLGGVGNATTIEYIEVIANKDDGIEFFGGQPRLKYILVSNCADDAFDYDTGFRGFGQYWVAIQEGAVAGRCGEHDGGTTPEDGTPYATPHIYNATYIGPSGAADEDDMIRFRDNAGGFYMNSIFAEKPKGISIELLATDTQDSFKQLENGKLKVENCIFWNVADNTPAGVLTTKNEKGTEEENNAALAKIAEYWDNSGNTISNPGISTSNPIPTGDVSGAVAPSDSWFDNVTYKGAFEPNAANWAAGWTLTFSSK